VPTAQRGGHRGCSSPPCPGGLSGAGSPPLRGPGQCPGKFFFGPYIRLGEPTYGFSVHGFGRDGFSVHGIGCSACINMYCNIERNNNEKSSW